MAESNQSAGNVFLSGRELQVSFRFSKARFSAIKSLKGASYNKELKRWVLPLTSLDNLLSSKLFCEKYMRYAFDMEAARREAALMLQETQQVMAEIEKNPFEVDEEVIAKADLDCVIRSAANGLRLFIKKRSAAKKIAEEIAGVHYLKNEAGYFLPTERLKFFLCELRDHKLSFAVSRETAIRLKKGAELRNGILSGGYQANAAELKDAFLMPYLCIRGNSAALVGATQEQLSELFPNVRGALARERVAGALSLEQVAALILNLESVSTKVWIARELSDVFNNGEALYYLNEREEFGFFSEFTEILAGKCEAVWVCDKRYGGLIVRDDTKYREFFKKDDLGVHPQFPQYCYFRPKENVLPEIFERIRSERGEVKCTPKFKAYYQGLLRHIELRERCQRYNTLSDCCPELMDSELERNLFPHQRVAVKWLLETEHAFLGDDMGLGKTLAVLAVFEELFKRGENDFLLVVAPNSLVLNWLREAKRWVGDLRFAVLDESVKVREAVLRELIYGDFYNGLVVNYEKVRLDHIYPALVEMCKKRRVMLCLDESQRVKNPTSKVCKALRVIAPDCPRRVLLSGTPTPRDLADIWSQMLLLDGGERFGTNYYAWLTSVAEIGNQWSEYAVRRFLPKKVDETIEKVQEVLLRRRKGDVIDLPEKLFSVRDLELGGDQAKRYDEVRKQLLLRVKDIDGNTSVKQIESILEEYLRAVQLASNPRIIDEDWQGEPVKFTELDEIVKEVVEGQGGKLVIWTNFRHNVKELVARYKEYGARPFMGEVSAKERDKTISEFQDPESKVRILVAIPAAGGVGITLTAAQTAVYLEKTWNAEHWLQSIDRIHRIGQTGTVTIISLEACPVDELISANLAKKMRVQAKLLGDNKDRQKVLQEMENILPTKEEMLAALKSKSKKGEGAEEKEVA